MESKDLCADLHQQYQHHSIKVTMTDDFDVKVEFCTQPYLFVPEYSDHELREMTKNTLELTLFFSRESEDVCVLLFFKIVLTCAYSGCWMLLLLLPPSLSVFGYQFSVTETLML